MRRQDVFASRPQFLEQFLPRSNAQELDLDVHVRPVAGQRDHVARQVHDLHGLAHVQKHHLAALAHRAGLDHQLRRLGDRHEVPPHVRMRDRHRPAPGDLLAEDRHDAARRPEDVPEPHDDELGAAAAVAGTHRLAVHLGDAFRAAHDARRIDRLVRRDEDEGLGAVLARQVHDVPRAEDVVLDRFTRVQFHHRDVLVRGRVEDHVRPVPAEHVLDPPAVTHVRHHRLQRQPGVRPPQFPVNVEQIVLRLVQDHEFLRLERHDLAAQFRTDRAPAARHQDDLVRQEVPDVLDVEADGLAAEDVVDVHLAQARHVRPPADEVGDARHDAEDEFVALRDLDDPPQFRPRRLRNRDDQFFGLLPLRDLGQLVDASQHRHAVDPASALLRILVHEPHDVVPLNRQAIQFPQHALARVARADDQRPRQARRTHRPRTLPHHPHHEPQAAHQRDRRRPVDDQNRVAHRQVQRQHVRPVKHTHDIHAHQNNSRRDMASLERLHKVLNAHVLPPPRVETEVAEHHQLHHEHEDQEFVERAPYQSRNPHVAGKHRLQVRNRRRRRRNPKLVPQRIRQPERNRKQQQVHPRHVQVAQHRRVWAGHLKFPALFFHRRHGQCWSWNPTQAGSTPRGVRPLIHAARTLAPAAARSRPSAGNGASSRSSAAPALAV